MVVKILVALKSHEMGLQGHCVLRRRAKHLDRRPWALIDGCERHGEMDALSNRPDKPLTVIVIQHASAKGLHSWLGLGEIISDPR